jgi:predicted GTPase
MFSDHDLDHHRLAVRMMILEQLVLKLFVMYAKSRDVGHSADLTRKLVRECVESLRVSPVVSSLDAAEKAMFRDESSEVFQDLEKHLEFILAGSL